MEYLQRAAVTGVVAAAMGLGIAPAAEAASTREPPRPSHPDGLYLPLRPGWSPRQLIPELLQPALGRESQNAREKDYRLLSGVGGGVSGLRQVRELAEVLPNAPSVTMEPV